MAGEERDHHYSSVGDVWIRLDLQVTEGPDAQEDQASCHQECDETLSYREAEKSRDHEVPASL
jgi:hypothetical protein